MALSLLLLTASVLQAEPEVIVTGAREPVAGDAAPR